MASDVLYHLLAQLQQHNRIHEHGLMVEEPVPNPFATEGVSAPNNWTPTGAGALWQQADGYIGGKSLRLNPAAATCDWICDKFQGIAAGDIWRYRCRVKGTSGAQFVLIMSFYQGDDSWISEVSLSFGDVTFGDWTEFRAEATAPALTAKAALQFRVVAADTGDLLGDSFSARKVA